MSLKLTQLWSLLLATRTYNSQCLTVGCYHAIKDGVSSVDQDSKIIASIGNELMYDDEGQSVCQGI